MSLHGILMADESMPARTMIVSGHAKTFSRIFKAEKNLDGKIVLVLGKLNQ
jgi:hypothetical protein